MRNHTPRGRCLALLVLGLLTAGGGGPTQSSADERGAPTPEGGGGSGDPERPADAITLDEARAIAEEHAGRSLEGVEPTIRDLRRHLRYADYRVSEEKGWTSVWRVCLSDGKFRSFSRKHRPALARRGEPALLLDDATEKARELALRHIGDSAQDMTWRVVGGTWPPVSGFVEATLEGQGPLVGDPPRSGLTPECTIRFYLPTGDAVWYMQIVPDPEPLVEVKVTPEDVIRIAREDVGNPDAEVLVAPELRQARGKALWYVRVARKDQYGEDSHKLYFIDGVSGEIVKWGIPN